MAKSKAKKTIVSKKSPAKRAKKRRFHPGTVALRDIRRHQKTTKLLLQKAPFERLIRKFADSYSTNSAIQPRFRKEAIFVLQEASEQYLTNLFRKTQEIACFNGRVEIKPGEITLVNKIVK